MLASANFPCINFVFSKIQSILPFKIKYKFKNIGNIHYDHMFKKYINNVLKISNLPVNIMKTKSDLHQCIIFKKIGV